MSYYRDWHAGMKVVCIDSEPHFIGRQRQPWFGETFPVLGRVYTIREIGQLYEQYGYGGLIVVRLVEIVNATITYGVGTFEGGYSARRFRPVQHRKTDIALFTAMLTKTGEKVPS